MFGAIIGDIVGSYYEVLEIEYFKKYHRPRPYPERMEIMNPTFDLFTENCSVTDDSILTCSIADCMMHHGNYEEYLKHYAKREISCGMDLYGRNRFGKGFTEWVLSSFPGESYGNGAAMRISPIGYLDCLEKVKEETLQATIPSHNHLEAIRGAEAIAVSIFLLRNGMSKEELKIYIEKEYYSLPFDLEHLRHTYTFSSKSKNSVPQALFVFFESYSFEDAIRKAISIGGDSDTIACMVGSLSEAYYGLDEKLVEKAKPYIRDYMWEVLNTFYERNKQLCKKN